MVIALDTSALTLFCCLTAQIVFGAGFTVLLAYSAYNSYKRRQGKRKTSAIYGKDDPDADEAPPKNRINLEVMQNEVIGYWYPTCVGSSWLY